MKRFVILVLIFLPMVIFAQKNASVSFEKWIRLKGVFAPVISPDGKTIVYAVGTTDWISNEYDSEHGWYEMVNHLQLTGWNR